MAKVKYNEGTLSGSDGNRIFYRTWEPAQQPRALLLIVHGLGEHGGRYQSMAEYFVARKFAVAALDQVGHGSSAGERCYVNHFRQLVDTLELFRQRVAGEYGAIPVVLLGHSLGGLVAANYLMFHQHKLVGCVLSGPTFALGTNPNIAQKAVICSFATVLPKVGVLQLDPSSVSRNPDAVQAYASDPLVYTGKIPARTMVEMLGAIKTTRTGAGTIRLPMLLLHGSDDSVASPEGTKAYHDRLAASDKTLKLYPGHYHDLFSDEDREQIFKDVDDWIEARLPKLNRSESTAPSAS